MTSPVETNRAGEGPVLIKVNGLLVDPDTGEIVGIAPGEGVATKRGSMFRVDDRDSAEWVLEKLFDAEAEMAALDRRLDTYTRNVAAMKHEHERRATWLRERFGAELEAWAAAELEGKKQRTVRTPFGKLSFRRRARRLVVKHEEAAIEWAKAFQPQAVKVTEKFLVSELRITIDDPPAPPGCEWEPERDTFKIDTGVES